MFLCRLFGRGRDPAPAGGKERYEYKCLCYMDNTAPWDYIKELNELGKQGWLVVDAIDASEFLLVRRLD